MLFDSTSTNFRTDELDEFYTNLKEVVLDTYKKNGNTKVVFIGHGLGSVLTTLFLNQQTNEFRETYVQSLISLGGSFGGHVNSVYAYLECTCAKFITLMKAFQLHT